MRRMEAARNFVKSYDLYGQPISLHYQGEDTFKTTPGGCISLSLLIIVLFYGILECIKML